VVTLIGGNGAGKSTALRAISGLLPPFRGTVEFNGANLTRLPPERIVSLGLALVPEGRRVFASLSVTANLELGLFTAGTRSRRAGTWPRSRSAFPSSRSGRHSPRAP